MAEGARNAGPSIAAYRFGDKVYPLRSVARCLTCQSPQRLQIETLIARGVPYARIARDLELEQGHNRVTVDSMRNHFNGGHMPVQSEAVRRVLERRATERGTALDSGIAALVDGQGFAELVLQTTVERMADGEIKPGIGEGLAAAKLLADLAPHESAASEADYVAAFMEYHRTAQSLMTPSQFEEFGRRLATNPVLIALTEKYAAAAEDAVSFKDDDDDFYAEPQRAIAGTVVEEPATG